MKSEAENIVLRYKKRSERMCSANYNILLPDVYMSIQEKERALIAWIKECKIDKLEEKVLLDVGCGNGNGIAQFIKLGFRPMNLLGCELISERANEARENLPIDVRIFGGDARRQPFEKERFDFVSQSTVFSSILNTETRKEFASEMWSWVKPGGGILWYDFIYNNPNNADVVGIKLKEVRNLFPSKIIWKHKLTLAPPVSRVVSKISPRLYTIFNAIYLLRTHLLIYIKKERKR